MICGIENSFRDFATVQAPYLHTLALYCAVGIRRAFEKRI